MEYVQQGKVTKEDKLGNDNSDENADKGVEDIQGRGLVKLGEWLAKRHDEYRKLMKRIQKIIATITIAEKHERAEDKNVNKIVLGCDPDVWRSTDMQIRDGERGAQGVHYLN